MKNVYILKEMNETRLRKIYANNKLKQFKIRNMKDLSTKQTKIHKMLNNAIFENLIKTIKIISMINENIKIINKI